MILLHFRLGLYLVQGQYVTCISFPCKKGPLLSSEYLQAFDHDGDDEATCLNNIRKIKGEN